MTDYETKSEYNKYKYAELLNLCRERNITGYRAKESSGTNVFTKEKMIKLLTENNFRKTSIGTIRRGG